MALLAPMIGEYHPNTQRVQPSMRSDYTILIVDDDAWFRLLVRTLLKRTPYRIIEAQDGIEGIAALRCAPVDLLMTDIVMPEQGGLATIDIARSISRP